MRHRLGDAGEHFRRASLCPAETTTPAATSDAIEIERGVALRGERHHRNAGSRVQASTSSLPGSPIHRGSWAPGRWGEIAGPSKWSPSGIARARPTHRDRSDRIERRPSRRTRRRHDRRQEGGHAGAGKAARHVADRVRIAGEVVTRTAVELQIDEPRSDIHARGVDDEIGIRRRARPDANDRSVCNGHIEYFRGAVWRDDLPAGQAQRAAGHITDSATRYARRAERSAPSAPTSIPGGEVIKRRLSPIDARNGDRCSRSARAAVIGSIKRRPSPIPTPPPITI